MTKRDLQADGLIAVGEMSASRNRGTQLRIKT